MARRWRAAVFVTASLGGCTPGYPHYDSYVPPPTAEIIAPLEGDRFPERACLTALGVGFDEDYSPAELAPNWYMAEHALDSTPLDESGTTSILFTSPNRGRHPLLLHIVNPDGRIAGYEIELVIFDVLDQPSISIVWPAADQRLIAGESLVLEATVSNDNPAETELAVRVESNIDGLLCEDYAKPSGEFACDARFLAGPHSLTFAVTNTEGGEASATVNVEALPGE